jgi:hypothetical protein
MNAPFSGPAPAKPLETAAGTGRHTDPQADAATRRFAQLTYTSYDPGDGSGGGWQVKDVRGGVTGEESRRLCAGVVTRVDPGFADLHFPTQDEIDALPRRLAYAPLGELGAAYWHSVPAGPDPTGRPGNVFAHVVLDREPSAPRPPMRPTDLLGAPHWLRPYGAPAVLATTLHDVPEPPWEPVLDRAAVVPFLVDVSRRRTSVLAAVLDAVYGALTGGRPVVLGVDEDAEAALWIAGIAHLMSPGTARRMSWSTADRLDGLDARAAPHLTVVPGADLAGDAPDGLVLLRTRKGSVQLGALTSGDPHNADTGAQIPVTPWSVLVPAVLQDVGLAHHVLAQQDAIAAELDDTGLSPGWPLAMAVSRLAELPELADANEEAVQLLTATPPPPLIARAPALQLRLKSLRARRLGSTTEAALRHAESAEPQVVPRDVAVNVYLERAIQDDGWLCRVGGVPLPDLNPTALEPALGELAAARVADLTASALRDPVDTVASATLIVRLIDLTVRAGLPHANPRPVIERAVDEVVGPLLADPLHGPILAAATGPLDPATARHLVDWLDRTLDTLPQAPGLRITPAVLRWVHPHPPAPPEPHQLDSADSDLPASLIEIAVQATSVVADAAALRPLAIWAALRGQEGGRATKADVRRLAAAGPVSPAEARALVAAFGVVPTVPVLAPVLLGSRSDDIGDVSWTVWSNLGPYAIEDTASRIVLDAAALRLHALNWAQAESDKRARLAALLNLADHVLASQPPADLAFDLLCTLTAAYAVDVATALDTPVARSHLCAALRDHWAPANLVDRSVLDTVVEATANGIVDDVELGAAALAIDLPRRQPFIVREVGLWKVLDHDRVAPLLATAFRWRAAGLTESALTDLASEVRHRCAAALHIPAAGELDRFARRWWAGLGLPVHDSAPGTRTWFSRRSDHD